MLIFSLLLLATAGALVVAGIVSSTMALLWTAIGMTLTAAVGLAVGVARNRPRRRTTAPVATTWSGAAAEPTWSHTEQPDLAHPDEPVHALDGGAVTRATGQPHADERRDPEVHDTEPHESPADSSWPAESSADGSWPAESQADESELPGGGRSGAA